MNIVTTGLQEPDRLAPSTHEAIRLAQEEAVRMQTQAVYPEHLLLGVIAQGENKAAKMMCRCGMDMLAIRVRATEVFGPQYVGSGNGNLPLARESLECIESAISEVMRFMQSQLVLPEHLVLVVLRHPRMQQFLTPFSSSLELIRGYLTKEMWTTFTGYVENPPPVPIGEGEQRAVTGWSNDRILWTLGTTERPTITFANIEGYDEAKRDLREVVEFLRKDQDAMGLGETGMMGVLLVGSPKRSRTYLIQATAGEAAVPLFSISIPALLQLYDDIATGTRRIESYELTGHEYNFFIKHSSIERYVHTIFLQAKRVFPCLLLIEDLDALQQIDKREIRARVLQCLLWDMELLATDENRRIAVIATATHLDQIDSALLGPGRLDRRVVLRRPGPSVQAGDQPVQVWDEPVTTTGWFASLIKLCPSCKKEALPHWKHCAYCGASLARTCSNCGAPQPEVDDARFCFECGNPLEDEI